MCCALPKCLCPYFQTRRLTLKMFGVFGGFKGWRFRGSELLVSGQPLSCQGTTSFPLWSHLGVLPTLTSGAFGILWTLTTSQFQRHFRVLPTLSPFWQSPTLLHAPSTPTPCLIPPPKATPRPPVSILKSFLNARSLMSELLSPRWSNWSEGHWLQLICCDLPKHLCP